MLDSIFKVSSKGYEIPWARPCLSEKEKEYLADAVESTWISSGPYLERFEEEFPRRIRARGGLAVSSGTAALQLAVVSLNLKPGDEVIVPGFSFAAVANVVMAVGARPVFADVDPKTWCLDPGKVQAALTPHTKAVIAVHLYGQMCDMNALASIARPRGIKVIEDAAEAAFSMLSGRYAGAWGDIGCFSFQATKTLAMGEGGFVTSGDSSLVEHFKIMRDHGMTKDRRYWHEAPGFNFRLTNLQAAVGCAQLERIDEILAKRRSVHALYREGLSGIPEVSLQLPTPSTAPVVWANAVKIDRRQSKRTRDDIMQYLALNGIETRPGFYPFSEMPMYQAPVLPAVSDIAPQIILLPSYADLTAHDINRICASLQKAVRGG